MCMCVCVCRCKSRSIFCINACHQKCTIVSYHLFAIIFFVYKKNLIRQQNHIITKQILSFYGWFQFHIDEPTTFEHTCPTQLSCYKYTCKYIFIFALGFELHAKLFSPSPAFVCIFLYINVHIELN